MGKRITDEQIEQINKLYKEIGVKAQVAKIMGISPATVTKYINPNYVARPDETKIEFDKEPIGAAALCQFLKDKENLAKAFADFCLLTEDEKIELKELQKEVLI